MAEYVKVTKIAELDPGCGRTYDVNGTPVAVFNVDGAVHAIDNVCLHRQGPLGEGALEGSQVTCPWHGWQYDVTSGACITRPGTTVKRYEVKVEDGHVLVAI